MYNPNSGFPMRNRGMFGASGYRYETLPYAQEGVQSGSLISKVMGLLATSFLKGMGRINFYDHHPERSTVF